MSNSIKAEDLQKELKKYLESYADDISEDVKNVSNEIAKEATQELIEKSPRGKGTRENPYHKGWTVQKGNKNKTRYVVKIHNKTNYQLTHLLEFGHATANGGRTKEIPHIRPVEKKYNKSYEKTLTTTIRRRSKN